MIIILTYQLQHRVLKKTNNKDFVFPNEIEIEVCLEPTGQFGLGTELKKTIVKNSKGTCVYNANTGKAWFKSNTFLNPVDVTIEWTNLRLEFKGNKVRLNSKCEDYKSLLDLLNAVHYGIPMLLNIDFPEPPVVKYTQGRVGDATFNWELKAKKCWFDVTDDELQEKRVVNSFQQFNDKTWVYLRSSFFNLGISFVTHSVFEE